MNSSDHNNSSGGSVGGVGSLGAAASSSVKRTSPAGPAAGAGGTQAAPQQQSAPAYATTSASGGAGAGAGAAMGGGPRVKWDDSAMKSSYANVCNVSSTREEVTLLFGISQAWHNDQQEVSVQLTDRIILSPFAAKRLVGILAQVVQQYEARFGPLQSTPGPTPVTPTAVTPVPGGKAT